MPQLSGARVLVLTIASALLAAPVFAGQAASTETSNAPTVPIALPFGTGVDIDAATHDPRRVLQWPVDAPGGPGGSIDDPGAPWGFPNDNTLGFTTTGSGLDAWRYETAGPIDATVDMGKLTKKKDISGEDDYILELYFDLVGWFWFDGDGVFDPAPGNGNGAGDDPCPIDPIKLFDVYVNGQMIRTVEGHNTQPCAPGGPETGRTFEIKPVGNDLPNQVRVPKNVIRDEDNTVRIVLYDFVTGPPNNPSHSESADGWQMYLDAVVIELAAPPLVLSHGWTTEWAPPLVNAPWQPTFRTNIINEFAAHTGQDPWRWANLQGKDGILLNKYDRKQDWRQSARELRSSVEAFHSGLGFSGKGWMHGHSMGGLVSRYYLEMLGGNAKIEKFAQTGTPNLGSWEAHPYTYAHWLLYEAVDGDYTAKWHWTLPGWPFDCCVEVWHGWRDWWSPSIWAYEHFDGPGHGRDHLGDFGIKPEGSNPLLQVLNARFPAPGVEYFTVRGDCNITTSMSCALSGPLWRGDGAVGLDSATMNGAIRHRTIDIFHEDIPAQVSTARWYARYYGGLDLDSGRPLALDGPGATEEGPSGSFFPVAPADLTLREQPDAQSGGAYLMLTPADVVQGPYEHAIPVDGGSRADFLVLAAPSEDPLDVALRAPDGALYAPDTLVDGVEYVEATSGVLRGYRYGVEAPQAGTWTLLLAPGDVPPAEGTPLYVSAFFPGSSVTLTARTAEPRQHAGEDALLLATLTGAAGAVTATTVDATGAATVVTLHDDGAHEDGAAGDGVHAARVPAGATDGASLWRVVAEGDGFRREADVEVIVASVADLRLASLAGAPASAWGGDTVSFTATLVSEGERAYAGGATVSFYDGDPDAGGALLGAVDLAGEIALGEERVVSLAGIAPAHAMTLYARVDGIDLELDLADNVASASMPFVPTPRTVATLEGERGEDAWLLGEASVTLAPFDGSAPGPIHYSLDGAEAAPYAGPLTIAGEGAHTLAYWSVDGAGRTEPTRTLDFGIDAAAPVASLVSPSAGHLHVATLSAANPAGFAVVAGVVDVAVAAQDGAGSGVSSVIFVVGRDVVAEAAPAEDGLWHALWDSTTASAGWHTLAWVATDAAGRETAGELRVYVLAGRTVEVERDPDALVARLDPREG